MSATMRAVRFDEYGEIEVLRVDDVERPVPGAGQVLVKVAAASINPGERSIRIGVLHSLWPATFPSGQGSDLAGTVAEVGAGVESFAAGDEVFGFTDDRGSHAEYVLVEAGNLAHRPPEVPLEQAATLYVSGTTAYAELRAVGVQPGDKVVITAAAGGVGTFAVQLAVRAGATVVGLASEPHHQWLRDLGAIPVTYGEGVAERIKAAVGGVDAFIDNFGGYTELALELGVDRDRINTIDRAAADEHGVKAHGNAEAAEIKVVSELADLIKAGHLEIPIAAVYPLAQVQDAFHDLEKRHTRGKIILKP